MRILTVLILALATALLAAAPTVDDEPESPYPLMSLDIPSQTVDGWYERGNPEREAQQLTHYLRALIWGTEPGAEAQALAEGRLIEVEFETGVVLMRETAENMERIRREVDPDLSSALRRRVIDGSETSRVSSGAFTSAPEPLPGIAVVGRDSPAQRAATAATTGGNVATMTLRLDDWRTWHDLRITLLEVYQDPDETTPTAVFTLELPQNFDEVEIRERRSVNFEGFRIRLLEAEMDPEQRVSIEVTDLVAQAR